MENHIQGQEESAGNGVHQAVKSSADALSVRVPLSLLQALWHSNTKARAYWDACEQPGADVDAAAADLEAALGKAEWHCGVFNHAGGIDGAIREQEGAADPAGHLLLALQRLVERFNLEYPSHRPVPHEVTVAVEAIARASGGAQGRPGAPG